jgi:hypothetical protein
MATYIDRWSTHVARFMKGKIIPLSLYEGGINASLHGTVIKMRRDTLITNC